MKRVVLFVQPLLLTVLLALTTGCLSSKKIKTTETGTHFAYEAIMPFIYSGQLSGAVNVFYKQSYQETTCMGYADVKNLRPITTDSIFMQCSQTKGFCGVTIAILIEEGKIKLDDPVSKYLPEFKELWIAKSNKDGVKTLVKAKNPLTIRMIMNHTGGLPRNIIAKSSAIKGGGWTSVPLRQTAIIAAASPLICEPGTKVSYSNTGFDIAAAIVEVVTGKKWDVYLKEEVLEPLDMQDTCFRPDDSQLKKRIMLYTCAKNAPATLKETYEWQQPPYNDDYVFPAAGAGLWTTVNDQLKFYKMLMNLGVGENGQRILEEKTVKELLAVSTRPKGMGGYSMGFNAPEKDTEDSCFGNDGDLGSSCYINWHKKELILWATQLYGQPRPWDKYRQDAANKFFQHVFDHTGIDAFIPEAEK